MFDMRIKELFFDRKAVIDAVDKAKRVVLSKGARFIRVAAKSSIRKRKRPSSPGQPPSSHTGLLRRILFGWDQSTKSVVVGPVRLNKPGMAPQALEHGGRSQLHRRRGTRIVTVSVKVDARPYMGPALKRELPKLPKPWANSVRG